MEARRSPRLNPDTVTLTSRWERSVSAPRDCNGARRGHTLLLHLLATVARLAGPGGAWAVVAESVLVKQQLLILNRSRKRSPNLRFAERVVAGVCTLLMRPSRLVRSAIV